MEALAGIFVLAILAVWIWFVVRIASVARENDRNVVGWVIFGIFLPAIAALILGLKHDDGVLTVGGAILLFLNFLGLIL